HSSTMPRTEGQRPWRVPHCAHPATKCVRGQAPSWFRSRLAVEETRLSAMRRGAETRLAPEHRLLTGGLSRQAVLLTRLKRNYQATRRRYRQNRATRISTWLLRNGDDDERKSAAHWPGWWLQSRPRGCQSAG